MARLVAPRRGEPILDSRGNMTTRFAEYIEGNEEETNEVEGNNNRLSSIEGLLSQANSRIHALNSRIEGLEASLNVGLINSRLADANKRIDELEKSNSADILNAKIARLSARMDALIDQLIEEIKKAQPDALAANRLLCTQKSILKQIQLLNAKTEEAFETDLEEDDV